MRASLVGTVAFVAVGITGTNLAIALVLGMHGIAALQAVVMVFCGLLAVKETFR